MFSQPVSRGSEPSGYGILSGGCPRDRIANQTYFIVIIKLPDFPHASVREERCIYLPGDLAEIGPTGVGGCFLDLKNSSVLATESAFSSSPGQKGLLFPVLCYPGVVWVLSHVGKLLTVGEVRLN